MSSAVPAFTGILGRLDRVRRRVLLRRRPLAALAAGVAVFVAVSAASSPPPPTVPVWTAARDLPAGTVLAADDLRRVGFAPASVPAHRIGSAREVLGRTLTGPVGRGQPVSDLDVVRPGPAARYPGRVAVPVRITDPAVAGLLRVGDRVSLVAADPTARDEGGTTLATDVAVVALPAPVPDAASSGLPGRLVLVAVAPEEADAVAAASASRFVTAVWLR
ncbi:MAG TPA: SAF domain-containing protein [Marmoricola sp.]|nr:SAF domain-containing protein [Marmoricola sp.]